jgi:hypothetical protein
MENIIPPYSPTARKMPPIDLTLAVNYIPAVVCLLKAALISFCLCILNPGTHLGGFTVFALLLNIDRAVSSARIFDENAVQLCILSAWVINYLRVPSDAPRFLNPLVSFVWLIFSLMLVLEFKKVQEIFVLYGQGSGGTFQRLIPAVFTSCMVGVLCFTPMESESGIVKSGRTVCFAFLCVAWVYVVTVWRAKPRHSACVFETHALVARFCPLLYVNKLLAFGFAFVCLGCICYHYVLIHVNKKNRQQSHEDLETVYSEIITSRHGTNVNNNVGIVTGNTVPSALSALTVPPLDLQSNQNDITTIDEEDEEALEAYFLTACQSKRGESV